MVTADGWDAAAWCRSCRPRQGCSTTAHRLRSRGTATAPISASICRAGSMPDDGRWPIWRSTGLAIATDPAPIDSFTMPAKSIGKVVAEACPITRYSGRASVCGRLQVAANWRLPATVARSGLDHHGQNRLTLNRRMLGAWQARPPRLLGPPAPVLFEVGDFRVEHNILLQSAWTRALIATIRNGHRRVVAGGAPQIRSQAL
jgi:hypothetical protein